MTSMFDDLIPNKDTTPASGGMFDDLVPRTKMQEIGRQIGLTARAPIDALAGIPAMIGNPLVSTYNYLTGSNQELPGAAYTRHIDKFFPKPEGGVERFSNAVVQGMSGAGIQAGVAGAAKPVTDMGRSIANTLTQNMGAQTASAATGAGGAHLAGEKATQMGLPDWAAAPISMAAGMVSGPVGGAAANKVDRMLTRADTPKPTPDAVAARAQRFTEPGGEPLPPDVLTSLNKTVGGAMKMGGTLNDFEAQNFLALRKAGVPESAITRAMVTRDPMQWNAESRLAKIPETGSTVLDSYRTADRAIGDNLRSLETRAQALTPEKFGNNIRGATGDVVGDLRRNRDNAYNTVRAQPVVQEGVPTGDVRQFLESKRSFFTEQPTYETALKELDRLSAGMPKMKIDNLETLRKSIVALRKPDGSNADPIGKTVGALDDAVFSAGKGAPFEDARAAHQIYRATNKDQPIIGKLTENNPGTVDPKIAPDRVFDTVVLNGNVQQLKQVVNTLRVGGQEAPIQQMRAQVLDHLANTLTPDASSNSGNRPVMFTKALDSLVDKLPVLFSPEEVAQLHAAGKASRLVMTDVGRSPVNRSNTGNEVRSMLSNMMNQPFIKQANALMGGIPGAALNALGGNVDHGRQLQQVRQTTNFQPQPIPDPDLVTGLLGNMRAYAPAAATGSASQINRRPPRQ